MAFAYQGFTYTTREKGGDLGPVHVTAERTRTLPLLVVLVSVAVAAIKDTHLANAAANTKSKWKFSMTGGGMLAD